jgi:hypothetical protein
MTRAYGLIGYERLFRPYMIVLFLFGAWLAWASYTV